MQFLEDPTRSRIGARPSDEGLFYFQGAPVVRSIRDADTGPLLQKLRKPGVKTTRFGTKLDAGDVEAPKWTPNSIGLGFYYKDT